MQTANGEDRNPVTLCHDFVWEGWATLNSDISQTLKKPKGGRAAVKMISHLGDVVMKVFSAE